MKTKHSGLIMGPAAAPQAPTATKFWNMASTGDDEGEITLYGDVMSQQPVDWWTGEPEPGLFITPEGFMEDLAAVKDKGHITVKLNSCGGDLYTGIAIHNALKALSGEVNVIVEGIAASAASVIMCAGDTVTVYPGSLIMIHGVSVMLWDYMNMQDMKQLMKVPVVIDSDIMAKLSKIGDNRIHGMDEADMVIMGKASDLPENLDPGHLLNLDGREVIVVTTTSEMGLVQIAVRQNRMS